MSKRILFLLHNPNGHTGLIGEKLQLKGYQLERCCHLCGEALPTDIHAYEAVVVFGGKMSVNDCNTVCKPLKEELRWIRQYVESGKPYLGICLGAQLLARAFGGEITRHHEQYVEIGYYNLYPTVDGFMEIFADAPEKFFQWHNEGFTIPENAIKLAASDLYPNQAFRIAERAYGFQFHPEATLEQIRHWHERDPEELAGPGAQTVPMQLRDYENYTPEISAWLDKFIDYWLMIK
ncbi:glutamine amidotransferase-related protein [Suttonella ornithocola]|nr:gamma-glutamyl-gamma-aminobutyrate hydrolase family protein [Suttonella ornithocola]